MKVDVIGTGKVGRHLFERMEALGDSAEIDARLVSSRTLEGLRPEADVILLAVSDTAIAEVASRVRSRIGCPAPRLESGGSGLLAHVSGSTPMEALGEGPAGVFYPFQSFAEGVEVYFPSVPFMIEGSTPEVRDTLFLLAERLGSKGYDCDGARRRELHLSGVLACNFVNELIGVAQERIEGAGLPSELIAPLVRQTVDKALRNGASNVRTGPAVRGDRATMKAHEGMLSSQPDLQQLYRNLSDLIISRSR